MNYKIILTLLAVVLIQTGCATKYSTNKTKSDGSLVVYKLTEKQAESIVATTLATAYPRQTIHVMPGAVKLFQVRTRVALDWWTTTVTIVPVTGIDNEGKKVDGCRLDVAGSGSSLTGRIRSRAFRKNLIDELDNSGTGTVVKKIGPRL